MPLTHRPLWRWLAGPVLFIVALMAVSSITAALGLSSGAITSLAPPLAFMVAWAAWWPIFRPNISFASFTAVGVVSAVFVAALQIYISV